MRTTTPTRGRAPRLPLLAAAGALVACAALTGCSGGTTTATDPAATDPAATDPATDLPLEASSASASPSTSPSTSPSASASPTVGTYPAFGPKTYAYTLVVSCFCVDGGVPVRVTVEDGEVVSAVYLRGGGRGGVQKGDDAPDYRRLTLDDVIDAANDTDADRVDVVWPDGQDHPSSVAVDPDSRAVDEEVAYTVRDVVVTG
ncbi:DUF6174 domain-containing protein [Nocardioides sp. GY 10127]|uniref:DUF6174 domain-containing protein n=1 Tax=Nocardioides sp. GY 10127 TaxID=2569762 RepID=UPI0010A91A16|nr:DUF6174 domain-containing protein [Nocardioides sp. GY 10127]TIC84201.1 hypothetical protein E8D37_05265 [Nocardioides sp. GY 10127]